jgi:ferredoxin
MGKIQTLDFDEVGMPRLFSVNVGLPPDVTWNGKTRLESKKFGSLLELAEACDIPVRWSCRTGVCHTCVTGLIGGSVIYNPEPPESPVPGNILVCYSQPNAGVTLDL